MLAGMGRKDASIEEAMETVGLASHDETNSWRYVLSLALIYTTFDEVEHAIDQLEHALTVPGEILVQRLRLHPNRVLSPTTPCFCRCRMSASPRTDRCPSDPPQAVLCQRFANAP